MREEKRSKLPLIISGEAKVAALDVLNSGKLSGFSANPQGHMGGVKVQGLEMAFCDYFGVDYAIATNSATAALHVALIACGIGPDDTVVVPAMSFTSSASCVLMAGAKPIWGDIDKDTFTLDVWGFEALMSTRAMIPVHLHGHPANMHDIMWEASALDLKVIEDASQAIGAKYNSKYVGTIGDCGVFSFNQNKVITCGNGGMLITNDEAIAETARLVRNHGETQSDILGYNYRMGEIEAAILIPQLRKLDELNNQRIELAGYLAEGLADTEEITTPVTGTDCEPVFFRYAMKFNSKVMHRNEFQNELMRRGVFFGGRHYGKPLYQQSIYGSQEDLCPTAERLYDGEIMVTDIIKPPATKKDIKYIVQTVKEVCNK